MARRATKRSPRSSKKQPARYSLPGIVVLVLSVVLGAFGIGLRTSPELMAYLPSEVREIIATVVKYLPKKENRENQEVARGSEPNRADLPHTATSFSAAKRTLYDQVYADHRLTFYCGCRYDKARHVDLASCGVTPRKNASRAQRVEAEHVFPAFQFGNFRACWRDPVKVCGAKMSGRECCEKSDPVFIAAHNDLFNLYPAVGEINGDRSNYNWGMIAGERKEYGQCDIEVDSSIRRAEPPESVRGDIARTMFYMADTYRFNLSRQDQQLYTAWSRQDPPDSWEIERDRRIAKIQGKGNRFIEDYEAIFGKR